MMALVAGRFLLSRPPFRVAVAVVRPGPSSKARGKGEREPMDLRVNLAVPVALGVLSVLALLIRLWFHKLK